MCVCVYVCVYVCIYIYIYYISIYCAVFMCIYIYIYICGMSPSNTVVNHFPFTGPATSRALCPGLMRPESRQLCSIVSAYQLNTQKLGPGVTLSKSHGFLNRFKPV